MESLSDEDARQQLYNSDFEKMRAALRAELREKQVESQGGVKPLCGSQMNDKVSSSPQMLSILSALSIKTKNLIKSLFP